MLLFYGIALVLVSWCRLSLQACTSSQFECPSTQTCLPVSWACDYYYDCSDNMDEDDPDWCPFQSADMSKAVIYSVNGGSSHLVNMFGDPDLYGPMIGNSRLANSLPLRYTGQLGNTTNTFGPITAGYQSQIVYYGNNNQGLIQYGHLVYNNVTGLNGYPALPVTRQINSLAFDWAAKNLYWIDGDFKYIAVLRVDGKPVLSWKVLVKDLKYPKDIVVNPFTGDYNCTGASQTCPLYLFWSDGNGTDAKIERSDLSGNNRVVLLNSTQGLVAPTTLVVDFTSQRLYWLDAAASTLGSVNFDGSNVTTWNRTAFSGFSTMSIYRNNIFFGDKTRSRIHVYSKTSVTTFGYKEFSRASGPITDMAMFAAYSQPTCNPCSVNNGNCSQLCFALPSNATKATSSCASSCSTSSCICGCANGFELSSDGLTCTIRHPNCSRFLKFLFLSDFNQWNIYGLQPDTGEIRTVAMTSYPLALTVDTNLSIIYFIHKADTDKKYRIHRRSFDGEIDESIFTAATPISRLAGLALDSIRGLLYYTDSYQGVVGELNTNGLQNRIIFQVLEEFPRAILVDSRSSRLYWIDCSQSPSIQTSRVDGTDRRTLITGTTGSCFIGLAADFIKQLMYFSNSTTVETSSLNGSLRTTLYTRPGADFNALTLMDDSLIIADRSQRIPFKYNLTSMRPGAGPLVGSQAIFSNISDIKFFDCNPGVSHYCMIQIDSLIFKPQYSNRSTSEYQTLFNRINTLLENVYKRTLGKNFVYIDDIDFENGGGVVVLVGIHLTFSPSDEMNDATIAAIRDEATADSLLVAYVNCSTGPFVFETTLRPSPTSPSSSSPTSSLLSSSMSLSQSPETSGSLSPSSSASPTSSPPSSPSSSSPLLTSPSGVPGTSPTTPVTTVSAISITAQQPTIWIIIGVVVGGGSFVIIVVIIIVCCVLVRLTARNKQDPSTPCVGLVDPKFEFDTCTLYQEIDDDQVADDVTPRDNPGYEHLRKQNKGGPSDDKYADYIAALPYAPMPPPSVRSFADCEGYMRLNRFFVRPQNIEMDKFPPGSVSTLNRGAPDYLQVSPPARSQNDYTEKAGSIIDGEVLQLGRPQNFYTVKEGIGGVTAPNGGDGDYIQVTRSHNYERIGEGSPGGQHGRIVSANIRDSILPDADDYLNVKESTCIC